jgi:hypothetical protein
MSFTLEDIQALRQGAFSERQVGELPSRELRTLGWRSPLVFLSRDSLRHINEAHPDINDFDLLLLPEIIRVGLLVQEMEKPAYLAACYQSDSKRFCAVMKVSTRSRFDIWLVSMRRMRPRQTQSILKRGRIIRPHK